MDRIFSIYGREQQKVLKDLDLENSVYEERKKIAFEMHDSIIQSLYATGLKIELL